MDGMEITQFTYFQQSGSLQLTPVSVEITYGLERILLLLQGLDHFKRIQYADGITYGELFSENERERLCWGDRTRSLFRTHAQVTFSLARQCGLLWSNTRESLGYPLGVVSQANNLVVPQEVLESEAKKVSEEPRLFILEIGTEELPPNDVASADQQLKDLIVQLLGKQRLTHGEVLVFGTPRRLVISVENLCSKQVANEVEVRGPPVAKAFDSQGNPTKAAEGFCRRNSVPVDSLYIFVFVKTFFHLLSFLYIIINWISIKHILLDFESNSKCFCFVFDFQVS